MGQLLPVSPNCSWLFTLGAGHLIRLPASLSIAHVALEVAASSDAPEQQCASETGGREAAQVSHSVRVGAGFKRLESAALLSANMCGWHGCLVGATRLPGVLSIRSDLLREVAGHACCQFLHGGPATGGLLVSPRSVQHQSGIPGAGGPPGKTRSARTASSRQVEHLCASSKVNAPSSEVGLPQKIARCVRRAQRTGLAGFQTKSALSLSEQPPNSVKLRKCSAWAVYSDLLAVRLVSCEGLLWCAGRCWRA